MQGNFANSVGENEPYPPWADLVITGKDLDPKLITKIIGFSPHRYHKRNDKKKDGIREWPNGAWIFSSKGQINSTDVVSHINWLANQLIKVKDQLVGISRFDDLEVKIHVFWIMPSTHEVISISSDLLNQLASINIKVQFSIYSDES